MQRPRLTLLAAAAIAAVTAIAVQPSLAAFSAVRPTPTPRAANGFSARQPAGNAPTYCQPAPCVGDTQTGGTPGRSQRMANGAGATFRLDRHVLRAGDPVTATVTPSDGCAAAGVCPLGGTWPVIDGVSPACGPLTATGQGLTAPQRCTYPPLTTQTNANVSTPQWRVATTRLQLSSGIDLAEDFYIVLPPGTSAIEGHINYATHSAIPQAGVRIDFQGSDGQGFSVTTNADGFFYAVVPAGTYSINPTPPDGTVSPPSQRVTVSGQTQLVDFTAVAPAPELSVSTIQDPLGTLLFGGEVRAHAATQGIQVVDRVFPTFNVRPPSQLTWGGKASWQGTEGVIRWSLGSLGAAGARDISYQLAPKQVVADTGAVIGGIQRNGWTADEWRGTSAQPVTLSLAGDPLVVSSAPAVLGDTSGEGILYRQANPVSGRFRVALSHGSTGARSRDLYIVLENPGSGPVTVEQLAWGVSQGGAPGASAVAAARQYLDRRALPAHDAVVVPAGGAAAVRAGSLPAGSATRYLSALYDLKASGPVRAGVVAVSGGAAFAATPLTYAFNGTAGQTLASAAPLPAGSSGSRGTFAHGTVDVTLPVYAADDGSRYGWRLDRAVLEPAVDTHDADASGYGVLFRVHLATTTRYPGAAVQALLNPLSGSVSGAASAAGGRAFAVPGRGNISSPNDAAGLGQLSSPTDPAAPWTLALLLSPRSHLPAALVFSPAYVRSTLEMTTSSSTTPVVQTNLINLRPVPVPPRAVKPISPLRAALYGLGVLMIPVLVAAWIFGRKELDRRLRRRRRHRRRDAMEPGG